MKMKKILVVLFCVLVLTVVLSAEDKKGQSIEKLTVSNPQALKYGDLISILNGWRNWKGGYLDTRCKGCEENYMCVSTADGHDRDNMSGTWKIISATGKREGSYVKAFDEIHLLNQYGGNGGYLDTRCKGPACESCDKKKITCKGYMCVSTSKNKNRDIGSGTWKIIPEALSENDIIYTDQLVRLLNKYNNFRGGFLDTCEKCSPNLLCVSTTLGWNRGISSTCWKFLKFHK